MEVENLSKYLQTARPIQSFGGTGEALLNEGLVSASKVKMHAEERRWSHLPWTNEMAWSCEASPDRIEGEAPDEVKEPKSDRTRKGKGKAKSTEKSTSVAPTNILPATLKSGVTPKTRAKKSEMVERRSSESRRRSSRVADQEKPSYKD